MNKVDLNVCAALAVAMFVAAMPAHANSSADESAEDARDRDGAIIVIGKSYNQDVGKTVTPLKDVPNTITVVNRAQIEAQNLQTLEDALTATVGITVNGVGSEDPSYLSRGFAINNFLVDGTPTLAFQFPAVVPDLFFYERIEILRGPAGLFSGSGNPAGSINFIRKRPVDDLQVKAVLGAGSYSNLRGELDVSVPVGPSAGLRAGVMAQDQEQFFDYATRNRVGAFIVGDIDLGERTTFTIGGSYDRYKPSIQSGLPGLIGGADGSDGKLLDIRRSTYVGADWNRLRSAVWTGFAELSHELADNWTVRASGMMTDVDRRDTYSYVGNAPVTETNGTTSHIAYRGDSFYRTRAADLNLIGSFSALGRDHSLIVGADYQWSSSSSYFTRLSRYATIDIYNPVSPAEPPLNPYGPLPAFVGPLGAVTQVYGGTQARVEQYGAYGQLRLSLFEGFTLVGGSRFTWWDTTNKTLLPVAGPTTGYGIHGRFTPYGGIVWDLTDDLNIYASYADSFTPQTNAKPRADGEAIQPLMGAQYEVGTKLSLFDDKLLLSAAVYQIEQSNRIFSDENLPDVIFQIGKVRSRGIEVEAAGEIMPGWRVNGGYSYTKTKYLEDSNALLEGISFVPVIPEHMVKLFTNYEPASGTLEGFSLGGGLTWFSSTFGGNAAVFNPNGTVRTRSSIVRQGSYAVVDLRAGYQINDQLSLSVNVDNVFDRNYYARISSTGRGNYYGEPRTVFATLRYTYQ